MKTKCFLPQHVDKRFEVKEYILPTYDVKVELPERVPIPDGTFETKVIATYTFGEVVEGEAVVTFWKTFYEFVRNDYDDYGNGWRPWWGPRGRWEQRRVDLFVKTLTIDSVAETFEVSIANDLKATYAESINVHVQFTEALTRKVLETSAILNLVNYAYEMVFISSELLVPNQPYNIKAAVRRIGSGVPVS